MSRVRDDITISAPQIGKTVAGQVWLLGAALQTPKRYHSSPWWWMAPTYQQCRHGFLGLCELAIDAGLMRSESRTTTVPLQGVFLNGVRIEGRSWERADNLRGPTILGGVVDEFGQLNTEAYGIISSRRAESNQWGYGWLRWIGNVGEMGGPAADLWDKAESGEAGFASRRWTWRDRAAAAACTCGHDDAPIDLEHCRGEHNAQTCPRGVYMDFIALEANRLRGPLFRQLYEAEWIDWNMYPAYTFDRAVHVDAAFEFDSNLPVDVSCDFNVGPMAWTLGHHVNDRAWSFDEICIDGGATTEAASRQLLDKLERYGFDFGRRTLNVYGDASGKYGSTRSKDSDYEIMRGILAPRCRHLAWHVPSANPAVATRLNSVNGTLKATDGTVRYGMHTRCKHLADDFARTGLKQGTRDLDKSDKRRTHFTDAEGYRLTVLFPIDPPTRVATSVASRHAPRSAFDVQF